MTDTVVSPLPAAAAFSPRDGDGGEDGDGFSAPSSTAGTTTHTSTASR
eukprot:CAMPEP_0202769212 /NCGR_PEP_ID=MMETSP1388-20130828/36228_1 /ASSEMBLY_ACC=CAM_ASM_000864 /TAXON_ID=37098 /ORGANISM="Isochrysis sp, Strain CCMP1244" /LENGTH=47 /DNA_ID= /DNA_START= /DNA_END= /DNA_ORIENTATION=